MYLLLLQLLIQSNLTLASELSNYARDFDEIYGKEIIDHAKAISEKTVVEECPYLSSSVFSPINGCDGLENCIQAFSGFLRQQSRLHTCRATMPTIGAVNAERAQRTLDLLTQYKKLRDKILSEPHLKIQ